MTNDVHPSLPSDFPAYNTTGLTIPAFTAVRITGAGTHPDMGDLPTIDLAQADVNTNMPCAGITTAEIVDGGVGTIRAFGVIGSIDTSAFLAGDYLYIDELAAGGFSPTTPGTSGIEQRVGQVLVSDATDGVVFALANPAMDGYATYTNRDVFEIWSSSLVSALRMVASGGSIVLTATPTGNRVITLPDQTTTLVGTDTTDTLTNKTFDTAGAGNSLLVNGGALTARTGTGTTAVMDTNPVFSADIFVNGVVSIKSSTIRYLLLGSTEALTSNRTLLIVVNDANRTLTIPGNATISGTNTGDQTITLTGNVTGSGTGSFAATIANDAVTNAKLADMATGTVKGRLTAGTGDPEDLTSVQARQALQAGVLFRREWQYLANPTLATGTVVGLATAPTLSGTVSNQDAQTRPFVRHVTGTTSGNSAGVLSGFDVVRSGWQSKTAFVIQTGASITSGRWWFGFTTADLTGVATPTTQNVAAFSYDTGRDGTVFWRTVTNDGVGAATVTATTTAIATATVYNLRIEMNGATNVLFYINDTLVNTHTTTLPDLNLPLGFQMSATTLTTGAGTAKRFEWSRVGGEYI